MNDRTDAVVVSRGTGEGQQSVSASTSSAATTNVIGSDTALIYSTAAVFVVAGASPTATVANGTPIPADGYIRLVGIQPTDRLAFITASGTGTVYVLPNK